MRVLGRAAEVGRLVPAIAGVGQTLDDKLEVALHRFRLARELGSVGVGEPRARLRLQLVVRDVLRRERKRFFDVELEVGGALAGDPVQEIQGDVVKTGITQMVEGAADVVRAGLALEHAQEIRAEGLRPERDAGHAGLAQEPGELGRHRLGIGLDGHLAGGRQGGQQTTQLAGLGESRRAAAQEDGFQRLREHLTLEVELREERVDVAPVQPFAPDDGHEVAVAAAMRAERHVHVQVADGAGHFLLPSSRLRTARKASCGTSTAPTCFIRRLPAFCFSRSFRLREMSPP